MVSPPLKTDQIFVLGSELPSPSFAGGSHLAAWTHYNICIKQLQMCCTPMLGGSKSIQVRGEGSELSWSLLTLHSSTATRICWGKPHSSAHPSLALGVDFSCSGLKDVTYSLIPPWGTVVALQHEHAELSHKQKVLSLLAQVTNIFTYLGQNWACGKCKYPSLMGREQNILIETHHALTVTGSDSKTHQGETNLFQCTDNTTGACNSYWGVKGSI